MLVLSVLLCCVVSVEQHEDEEEEAPSKKSSKSKMKKHEEEMVMEFSIHDVDPSTGTQKLYRKFLRCASFLNV